MAHNLTEVSVMMPEEVGSRDIVVKRRGGGVQEFKDTNRAADALHFVLLHSRVHDGWSPDQIGLAEDDGDYESRRLTCNKYYKYQLQQRPGETKYYLLGGRLFDEYVCLNFAKAEQQRFNFVGMNQTKLQADLSQHIVDQMMSTDVDENKVGRQVILPATYIGSPRDMHARLQDAMAVVIRYRQPHLFITMACKPTWK